MSEQNMMLLSSGTLLQGGKYKIISYIASGGFGNTYEAVDTSMGNTRVAIKEFFVKDFCSRANNMAVIVNSPEKQDLVRKLKKKFLDEALAIFRMRHDNIVRVYSRFEENDTAYYVMEYVDGEPLTNILKKKNVLLEDEALRYIRQIASALSHVHSNKCCHLDVKPANIIIGSDGKAILIDFGASKYYNEDKDYTTTTLPGLYTPGYAPYEQTLDGITEFTPASDIYSLGATLYRMLSGDTPPASGLLLGGYIVLPPLPNGISEFTRKAVEKAMEPRKKNRTQSIEAFLRDLGDETFDSRNDTIYQKGTVTDSPNDSGKDQDATKIDLFSDLLSPQEKIQRYLNEFSPLATKGQPIRNAEDFERVNRAITIYESFTKDIQVVLLGLYLDLKEKLREAKEYIETKENVENFRKNHAYILNKSFESISEADIPLLNLAVSEYEKSSRLVQNRLGNDTKKNLSDKLSKAKDIVRTFDFYVKGVMFKMKMVKVEGGTFTMGATENEILDGDNPAHIVTLTNDYYIGQTEVTQNLWETVMGCNPSRFKGNNRPVENVSWDDCQMFISKLNSITGKQFRLPTEAEWEFAARGGNNSKGFIYSGSNNLFDVAFFYDNCCKEGGHSPAYGTHDVATLKPNELGIYDMSGNVYEWCSDWYGDYESHSPENPVGPMYGEFRVFRGGSWNRTARYCILSDRNNSTTNFRKDYLGLRLALSE